MFKFVFIFVGGVMPPFFWGGVWCSSDSFMFFDLICEMVVSMRVLHSFIAC